MELLNTRDRYGNTSFNTGLGEVPEYLQYKKKSIQNCIAAKKRVKQDIVTNNNLTAGNIINIRLNSQNWFDPQSLRVGFNFNTVIAPTTNAKFNDDTGINGIFKSIKVNTGAGGRQLESISNYNLLQKIQYSCSVSNDWKQAQGGLLEGFGSFLTSTTSGLISSVSSVLNGPPIGVAQKAYSIALWTGMLGQCTRLLPNMLLQINFDLEFAPLLDFLIVDGGTTGYQVNNVYVVYDEYIVSDLYRQVFEEAVRTKGISFDYNTITNVPVQQPAQTTAISATINDSAKQLLSVYATIRPSDIAMTISTQAAVAGAAAAVAPVITAPAVGFGNGLCTNLETIDGSKVVSAQCKLGTTNYPEFPLTKTVDMYNMSLQSMNRANSLQLDMPLSYNKYMGPCRTFWIGCDFENSKSMDNSQYTGINTSGHAIVLKVTLSDTTTSTVDAGVLYTLVHPTGATAPGGGWLAQVVNNGSNGGNANSFF